MKWSFKIGSAFGIELRIHVTFFLIILWAAYVWGVAYNRGWPGAFYGALVIVVLFACVVIHELCHSRMAQHYGAEVASITLLPIGGVSMLKQMPEEPMKEFWVTVVGPASNVVIAIIILPFIYLVPNPVGGPFGALTSANLLTGISLQAFVSYMFLINLLLAGFNLIPAFPLDGGRLLRSILARRMTYVRATRIAVLTGQAFAFALGIFGLLTLNPIIIIIAIFVYMGAEAEGAGAEMKNVLSGLKVSQAVTGHVKTVAPDDSLADVVHYVLHEYQEDFPVVKEGRLEGVLTRSHLIKGLHSLGPEGKVGQVMETDFPVVSANAPFSEVYQKMNETRLKAVPVMEDGHLIGMVTLEHLSEVFMLLTSTDRPLMPASK